MTRADVIILRDLDQGASIYAGVSPDAKMLSVNQLADSLKESGKKFYYIKEVFEIYS